MPSPADRRYTQKHEWHKLEADGTVSIGITQFAADALTDITYLEVLKKSGAIKQGQIFGEIESVKTADELYCGVDGTVVAFNQDVLSSTGLVNKDAFAAWIVKVKPSNPAQLDALMDAKAYDAMTAA